MKFSRILLYPFSVLILLSACTQKVDRADAVDFVDPLIGTMSKFSLSTGNTYPAIAMPWGMNFWTPQTGDMGGKSCCV